MSVNSSKTKWVRLGDYIMRSMANNNNLNYGTEMIEGVNSNGEFCTTKASLEDINLKPYKIVQNGDFVYNPSRLNIGSLAYRQNGMCIVSHLYVVFRLNDLGKKLIVPEFLYLFFNRDEFLRLITYLNFGSQRPEFNFYDMSEIQIPLPNIDVQQELVDTYHGLNALAEQNEALIQPLTEACQAYIIDCKKKYSEIELGGYIDFYTEKNSDCEITLEQGINIDKVFINPHRPNSDLSSRIIVRKGQFAYCTQLNNENVAIAYRKGDDCVVSPVYKAFEIKQEFKDELLPEYLFLWLKRKEFGRFVYWRSVGSAYEFLQEENIREYRIPIPSPEVQQAIIDVYNCSEEAKKISTEARDKMKTLCPALVQRAING